MWIRATLPRFRYDRLMYFGWKVLIPVGLLWILITGAALVLLPIRDGVRTVVSSARGRRLLVRARRAVDGRGHVTRRGRGRPASRGGREEPA